MSCACFAAFAARTARLLEADCRQLLKDTVREAREAGFTCRIGAEFEFYLLKTDENGRPTRIPFDHAGYMDVAPEDAGENMRREICLTLEEMGILPESSHHEEGPGQNEIDFKHSDPLTAADNAVTFKTVVQNTAARNGLYASFAPSPLTGRAAVVCTSICLCRVRTARIIPAHLWPVF